MFALALDAEDVKDPINHFVSYYCNTGHYECQHSKHRNILNLLVVVPVCLHFHFSRLYPPMKHSKRGSGSEDFGKSLPEFGGSRLGSEAIRTVHNVLALCILQNGDSNRNRRRRCAMKALASRWNALFPAYLVVVPCSRAIASSRT
jgi:hypothetical protein